MKCKGAKFCKTIRVKFEFYILVLLKLGISCEEKVREWKTHTILKLYEKNVPKRRTLIYSGLPILSTVH